MSRSNFGAIDLNETHSVLGEGTQPVDVTAPQEFYKSKLEPALPAPVKQNNVSAWGRFHPSVEDPSWDHAGWRAANGPIDAVIDVLREVFAEPIANFSIGAARGTAELGVGVYEFATQMADKAPDMEPAAREDFIKKIMDEVKTWEAYDGDDGEAQFMDKVFYHLGHAAPGMLAAIGATMAAGVAAPAIASAVGLGNLAKYGFQIGNAFRFNLGTGTKFATTFAAGSTVSVAQEYANALAEGREADGTSAFVADAGFNAAFSAIFHFNAHLPISNMWKMITAGSTGSAITLASGGSAEEATANAILFALMQGGQIRMSSNPEAPGAVTQAYRNIMNWVAGRKAKKEPVGIREYFKEFKPITFQKEFYPDDFTLSMNETRINPDNELSLWDAWIRQMEHNYELGSAEGIQPHQIPELIFNEWKTNGAVSEKDRPQVIRTIKAEVDAKVADNKRWMKEYYDRTGTHYTPKYLKEDFRYLDGIEEPVRDLTPVEKIDITKDKDRRKKVAVRTYVGRDGKPKTKELKLWQLSQDEAVKLFTGEPDLAVAGMLPDAATIRSLHRQAVEERLEFVNNAEKYKTRVPPVALKAYKDTLGRRYSHLYVKKKSLTEQYANEDGFDVFLRENMEIPEYRKYAYESMSEAYDNSLRQLQEIRKKQSGSLWKLGLEGAYQAVVGSDGLMSYRWRQKGGTYDELADAFHMQYGSSSKTEFDWHLLDKDIGIQNWSPEYLKEISLYYRALSLRAHKRRKRAQKNEDFETQQTMLELRAVSEEIQARAMEDNSPWSLEDIYRDVEAIKNTFDTSLDYAYENGMVSERAFHEIREYTWMPLRKMIDLEKHIRHIGSEADRSNAQTILKYLQKAEESDTQFDIRHLLHGQLARVNNAVAKTRILQAARRVAEKHPEQLEFVIDPDKATPFHREYEYLEDGKLTRIFLDEHTSSLLDSSVFTEAANKNLALDALAKIVRIGSGAAIRQQLVSADPSFGFSMAGPDMMHIIMTHPEFHTNSFSSGWLDLYKLSAEYGVSYGNRDHGVKSWAENVWSVYKKEKDGDYHQFIKDGGSAITLARADMDRGLLDNARKQLLGKEQGIRDMAKVGKYEKKTKLRATQEATIDAYQKWIDISAAMEMGARLTEYQMLKARGVSGTSAAAKVTERLNYGRSGAWTNGVRKVLPFLNAGIQSTDSVVKMAINNPKAVAKMMPQLMLAYGAIRALNESMSPGAEMDRPLEDRIRSSTLFIPGATVHTKDTMGGRPIHYGIQVKDALHPVAATAKLLSIAIGDYWYQKSRPEEFPNGPEIIPGEELVAAYSVIASSAPVELRGFIPPLPNIIEIYTQNTIGFGEKEIYPKEGQVSRADEIIYSYEGGRKPTGNIAINTARQMQIILPNHWSLSSPARLEAAGTQLTPSNTLVDAVKYPFKIVADGDGYLNGYAGWWRQLDEIAPGINRHIVRNYPGWAKKQREFVAADTKMHLYEKKVMQPIRPMMAMVDKKFEAAINDPNRDTGDLIIETDAELQKMAKELVNNGEWNTSYGDTYKKQAEDAMLRYLKTMKNWYIMDGVIKEANKKLDGTPFENATQAIGSVREWTGAFKSGILPEHKAAFLFDKWRYVYEMTKDAPTQYANTIQDRFKAQKDILVKGKDRHSNDGTLAIYEKKKSDYLNKKGLP